MRVPIAVAAAGTGVPARTLRRWVAEGRLTAVRKGRTQLVDVVEVLELDERRAASGGNLTSR